MSVLHLADHSSYNQFAHGMIKLVLPILKNDKWAGMHCSSVLNSGTVQ